MCGDDDTLGVDVELGPEDATTEDGEGGGEEGGEAEDSDANVTVREGRGGDHGGKIGGVGEQERFLC